MATTVKLTRILPLFPREIFLQWEIASTDTGPFTVTVERGGSPTDLTTLVSGLSDAVNYTDTLAAENTNILSIRRDFYYRIKVVPTSPTTPIYSDIENLDPDATTKQLYNARLKLRRDFGVRMRVFGTEISILKRRHFGTNCTNCYDSISKMVTQSNCNTCYGTRWVGGYHTAYLLKGQIYNSATQESIDAPEGKIETRQARILLPDYPKVDREDIIIALVNNKRFEVDQVVQTEIQFSPIHQSVVGSLLSPTDNRYRLIADTRGGKLSALLQAPNGGLA